MLSALVKPAEDRTDQLLKLYWNRANVKRELKSLQKERYELLDKLKDQKDEILRAKEQLDGLERLLVDPMAAANAMVYFQLRHLWRIASLRLDQLGTELEQQREKKERARLQDAAVAKRHRRLEAIDSNLLALEQKQSAAASEAVRLAETLRRMNAIFRLFRARRLRGEIQRLEESRLHYDQRIDELKQLAEKIQGEPLPEPDGLSVESRRIVNTALIALAQHLALHFSGSDLATLALAATQRSVGDMKFGDRRECDRMVECIRDRIADLKQQKNLAELVKQRASFLARELAYRNETDVVPTAFSTTAIKSLPTTDNKGRRDSDLPLRINVIADDYWDLGGYLR
jgi:hypothetical protein